MRYKLLGKSGLRVSELCIGTMTFGEEEGWGASKDESRKILEAFAEAGGNFVDTANNYSNGTSERWIGEFIGAERHRFVLATKYTFNQRRGDPNAGGNHRKNLVHALEGSLQRLRTDYVDLYWVHAWDALTPVEETMRALDDVVRAGKVLYLGISNMPAWLVAQANTLAQHRCWTPFVALQVEYSLIERTPERELLPMARAFEMAVAPWSPLGGGLLSGKYVSAGAPGEPARLHTINQAKLSPRNLAIAETLRRVAAGIDRSPAQVGLAWLRAQGSWLIPILGARTLRQLQDNLGCLEIHLAAEHLVQLDDASKIELGYPHDFLARPRTCERLHGGTFDSIDAPRR